MEKDSGAQQFSYGVLNHYEPPLKKLEKQISDLVQRQEATLKEIEIENAQFKAVNNDELTSMFTRIREYQIRLMNVKKEMVNLTERSTRLKKRGLKLQQLKQKEALENAHYREAQLKREQDLIARPNPKPHPGTGATHPGTVSKQH